MKKIYCVTLIFIMILNMMPVISIASGNYESIEIPGNFSNKKYIYENMEMRYNYNGETVFMDKAQISYDEFETILKTLSDEYLTFSDIKSEDGLNTTDELFPKKGYVDFLDENDGNWIIAFDENKVYARCIDPINKTFRHGFFSYKTNTVYNDFCALLDNIASKVNNSTAEQPGISAEPEKEKHSNQINISNMKQIYEASFPLDKFNGDFSWGICSYTRKEESEPVTVAYMTFEGNEFLRVLTENVKDNRIIFEQKRVAYFEKGTDGIEYDMNFDLSHTFEMQLSVNADGLAESAVMYYQNIYTGDEKVYTSDIDMVAYKQSGYLPDTGKISFKRSSNTDPGKESKEKKEDTALTAYSSRDFLSDIKNGNPTLSKCSYHYEKDGKSKSILKSLTQMNVYGTQKVLRDAFDGYSFVKNEVMFDFDTNTAKIEIDCQTGTSPKTRYEIYVFDDCIVVESSVPNPDDTGTHLTVPLYIRYTYSGESLVKKLTPHFEKWIEDSLDSDIMYTDVSKLEAEYIAEFEFEADDEMLSSWIGEVCENGKVKCKITYFDSLVMLTLSGNGKSYNLMRTSAISGASTYTNLHIGVDKDTPIPNEMAQTGYIHLNWSTISGFYSKDDLSVRVYDSHGVQAGNPTSYGMIGSEKEVIKLGDVTDNKTQPNSPVTEAEARGNVFDDVPDTHWAKNTVENYYYAGIVRGTGGRMYEPDNTMTYEHFGILLKRLFDYDYANAKAEPALRQDVFKALIDAMDLPYEEWDLSQYSDADSISDENLGAVKTAVRENIVEGFSGSLNANGYLTRAEAITLIDRAIKKVYEIDEAVKPEYYKTYILPSNGYTSISADSLTDFKVKYETEDIYIKNDSERLSGKIVVTFGDDVINDSRVYGVFEADGNIFTAESLEFSQIIVRKNEYVLRGEAVVYKNGRIFDESRSLNVVFNTEDREVYFGSESQTFYAYFENTRKTLGKEPKEPEIQPYEIEAEIWDGGLIIAGGVTAALINGEVFETKEANPGSFSVTYSKKGDDARVNITISKTYPDGGKCVYKFTLNTLTAMTDSEIQGLFTVRRDGETVFENMPCVISGIDSKLKTEIIFTNNDGSIKANLFVTESGR